LPAHNRRYAGWSAQAQPLARVRPRRKRNEDGGVPPMDIYGLNRSALMFPRDPKATA